MLPTNCKLSQIRIVCFRVDSLVFHMVNTCDVAKEADVCAFCKEPMKNFAAEEVKMHIQNCAKDFKFV